MKIVKRVQTYDNILHESTKEAKKHLDKKFGEIITKHAHRLSALQKYTDICDYLEENLKDFKNAIEIQNDLKITCDEE